MYPSLLLLQEAEHGFSSLDVLLEYIGFVSYFATFGALGFRFAVLRGDAVARSGDASSATPSPLVIAGRGAAMIGAGGAVLMLVNLYLAAANVVATKGGSIASVLLGRGLVGFLATIALLVGFLVARRINAGWYLALLGGLTLLLRNVNPSRWFGIVNPLHEIAASLWLGTLLVLVVVGLPSVLRLGRSGGNRGQLVATLVSRFSPLALASAGLLALTGVITAWRHLHHLSSLWTTSYGYALDVKLVLVAVILALGAWNWKRMTPRLGTEQAAGELRRSATAELFFGALVLLVTAILVNLPAPRDPAGAGGPGQPGGGRPPAGAAPAPAATGGGH